MIHKDIVYVQSLKREAKEHYYELE